MWLDDVHTSYKLIEARASRLQCLSEAFRSTGNETMYHVLNGISEDLYWAVDKIREGVNTSVNEHHDAMAQSTTNMLNGVLAGISLGKVGKASE